MAFDTTLPSLLSKLHALQDAEERDWMDFEARDEFQSSAENDRWMKAWTGNGEATAQQYRIFGTDGTGGYAAIWLARPTQDLLEQPIVFFGSEGETAVIAKDFAAYTWILAGGCGPYEAAAYLAFEKMTADWDPEDKGENPKGKFTAREDFIAFAQEHFPNAKKAPLEIIAEAGAEFPTFAQDVTGES